MLVQVYEELVYIGQYQFWVSGLVLDWGMELMYTSDIREYILSIKWGPEYQQ